MKICSCCGKDSKTTPIEEAHVKDKSVLIDEGVSDHRLHNIIDLCQSCHTDFDNFGKKTKMGLKEINGVFFFFKLTTKNKIEKIRSKSDINVLNEYIQWKNKRVDFKLMKVLFLDN